MIIPVEISEFCRDNSLTLVVRTKENLILNEDNDIIEIPLIKITDEEFKSYDEVPIAMLGQTSFTKVKNILTFSCTSHMMVLNDLEIEPYKDGFLFLAGPAYSAYANDGFTVAGNIIKNINEKDII